ncbi:Zn-dependent protease with chaperone function [Leptolyngbya sp. 'hensonii']|uniref:M56 family metallopeptidase n=1 Tax=Leptolyngbya sp. 'hensonii' TaxID=1922337 RepID=UPI00094F67DC|nr:M56 family metallopeptidase [Leptolyngbya sp. 'hensonii']OLP20002.1 Zn-dependent protease with chaperone function [Leptolyngbya sp. 'hensonii']
MHFLMLLTGLGVAWWVRSQSLPSATRWSERWTCTLYQFLFPPLFLLATTIAIVCMGPHGWMVWPWEGWLSYGGAIGLLLVATLVWIHLLWQGQKTWVQIHQYPTIALAGATARLLQTPELYIAQVGFWQSELVISQGLLNALDPDHLQAVLAHEQAHARYRDTFWFFWLGWLRRLTTWLPQTEALWQELLLLRELRADDRAVKQVDPLLLAESLLLVVSQPTLQLDMAVPFSQTILGHRLTERVDILLAGSPLSCHPDRGSCLGLLWSLLPLLIIPLHITG